jgi:methylated-DNA-[protein]-cysteine S-methyltransferase
MRYLIFGSSLGWLGLSASEEGLKSLILPQPAPEQTLRLLNLLALKWRDRVLSEVEAGLFGDLPGRIRNYLDGKEVSFPDRLDLSEASPFEREVWRVTRSIPYGETRAYGWVAGELGMPRAARAVGQALGRNPLPIMIPCHRVICSDGNLGGFSAGGDWKRRFLQMEAEAL